MRFDELKGIALIVVTSLAGLWLAATGQLNLYIHPRYIIFTVVFAAIALLLAVFGAKYGSGNDAPEPVRWPVFKVITIAVCAFGAAALIASKPAALTSATATQRGVNTAAVGTSNVLPPAESPLFGGADYSGLTIKDWASLLATTDDPDFFTGKNVDVTGFVVADQHDSKNVFYVSRFAVTCCAVDARPIGVPVYMPDWRQRFAEDQWVQVIGAMALNPSSLSLEPVAVMPAKIEKVAQPEQVYDF